MTRYIASWPEPRRGKLSSLTRRFGAAGAGLFIVVVAWRVMTAASARVDFAVAVVAALIFAHQFER
jgi:hypothetical protein